MFSGDKKIFWNVLVSFDFIFLLKMLSLALPHQSLSRVAYKNMCNQLLESEFLTHYQTQNRKHLSTVCESYLGSPVNFP